MFDHFDGHFPYFGQHHGKCRSCQGHDHSALELRRLHRPIRSMYQGIWKNIDGKSTSGPQEWSCGNNSSANGFLRIWHSAENFQNNAEGCSSQHLWKRFWHLRVATNAIYLYEFDDGQYAVRPEENRGPLKNLMRGSRELLYILQPDQWL